MAIRKPFFVVPLDLGTVVSGNVAAGHSVFHLARFDAIGLTWKTDGDTNVWARGDFGSAQAVDFLAIVAANALPGTQFRLRLGETQAEVDGAAPYDSAAQTFISPSITSDDDLYHSHWELPSLQTYRWWRIDITGHTGDFEAASVVMGKKFEPSRYYNYGFGRGIEDLGGLSISPFGIFDEQPGIVLRRIQFTLAWVTEAEFETGFQPMLRKLGKRGVVYLCFDPESGPYRQSKTYMGPMDKLPFATGVRKPGTYSMDFQLLSTI